MPTFIALHSISLVRDGTRVDLKPGEAFDFTDEEVARYSGKTPRLLRRTVNETATVRTVPAPAKAPVVNPPAPARAGGARGASLKNTGGL